MILISPDFDQPCGCFRESIRRCKPFIWKICRKMNFSFGLYVTYVLSPGKISAGAYDFYFVIYESLLSFFLLGCQRIILILLNQNLKRSPPQSSKIYSHSQYMVHAMRLLAVPLDFGNSLTFCFHWILCLCKCINIKMFSRAFSETISINWHRNRNRKLNITPKIKWSINDV